MADSAGGAWICWYYEQTVNHLSTFVQHVDSEGNVAFPVSGLETSTNLGTLHPILINLVPLGTGGVVSYLYQSVPVFLRDYSIQEQIPVDLPAGLYLLRVVSGSRMWTERIAVN